MNMNELVSMGGHAPYVWGAIGVCLGVMALELAALGSRSRAARRALAASGRAPLGARADGGAA